MAPIERELRDRTVITGWVMRPERRTQFEDLLSERCWFLRKQDCVDLPEQVDQYRCVELSRQELDAYDAMRDELRAEFNNRTVSATAVSKLMKLRQIAGGILYDHGAVHEIGGSKLAELLCVLNEIGDRPVVIWAEFTADIDRIASRLSSCRVIDGRTSDPDRQAALSEFGNKFQYLVCHPKAVGHGVTMTQASYAIYYSLGFSYETYVQSRDRIHRIGQTQRCTYIHLLAISTCDSKVLKVLKNKGSLHDAMRAALEDNSVGTRKRETVH